MGENSQGTETEKVKYFSRKEEAEARAHLRADGESSETRFDVLISDSKYAGPRGEKAIQPMKDKEAFTDAGVELFYKRAVQLRHWRTHSFNKFEKEGKLEHLAEEIRVRVKITKQEIFIIGELLHEAKAVARGGFKKWIEDNFDFSYEHANNFMNVYKYCLGYRQVATGVKPSLLYQVSSPSFSDELRHYLFTEGYLAALTGKELKQIHEKFEKGGLEAIKPVFEKIVKHITFFNQVTYSLDQLELLLRVTGKVYERLRVHGDMTETVTPIEDHKGLLPEGDDMNVLITNTILEKHQELDRLRVECWKKVEECEAEAEEELE